MTTNEEPRTQLQQIVELSTVYFYEGAAPRVIALKDCGLPMKTPVPRAFAAFYGYQSKQEGFMAARNYAENNRQQFIIIDLLVKLDKKQNPLVMKPDDLPNHDFITFQRLSRRMMNDLHQILKRPLEQEGVDTDTLNLMKLHSLLSERPELISSVINEPSWEHIKILTYLTKTALNEKPMNVGIVPFRHWNSILKATCLSNIKITLDPPDQRVKDALVSAPSLNIPSRAHRA
ncbi:hypothetical protein [Xylella fastidiosa]|nr:hypothetical protein [Xylella fastidiosa]